MTKRNPKQEGTCLYDCVPQSGKCPMNCNQCFFNREGAFYTQTPSVPTLYDVGDGIVRMNCGHDSNIQKELVLETAKVYPKVFFNTSIPNFDFPGPVVFTANPKEEGSVYLADTPKNLMFVRLRVSATNLPYIKAAVNYYTGRQVPVVLTFMSYYTKEPEVSPAMKNLVGVCYEWKVRHINSYWCPTKAFIKYVMGIFSDNRLVSMCSSIDDSYCRACRNCETYYLQTMKRMRGE